MLGRNSMHAAECLSGGFIGAGFGMDLDLTGKLPDDWRTFNKQFAPIYLAKHPAKSRISAGLACGALWTISKGIAIGDTIVSPDGSGRYRIGEVIGDYFYHAGEMLPHRRPVRWLDQTIRRDEMSTPLQKATRIPLTVVEISGYRAEIEQLISGEAMPKAPLVTGDLAVEDPTAFAMEKHLEDFLVQNWMQTELGKEYDIFEENGEQVGQQYPTDTGPLDILAISKDKKRLLVVELKKGRASDAVVGQALRYMGFVQDELAEQGQTVKGVIIALEDDARIRRALAMVPNIEFYRYQISFKLVRA